MIRRLAPLAAVIAGALAVSGCSFSLFPKSTPAQLYRFGGARASAASDSNARFSVLDDALSFDRAASGDQILTINGNEVAYIKGGRWATSAPAMFQEALQRAFDNANGPARLVERGETAKIDDVLRLNVTRFEARYDQGAGAAPTVLVRVYATLTGYGDRKLLGAKTFEAEAPAGDNRIGAISGAFDQATAKVLGGIVDWVSENGAPAAAR